MTIDPKEVRGAALHAYLLGAVTPRPIAFASTIDASGNVNLSPFSFFNCFGSNPPILIFSPARRGRDNTTKHTYENLLEVPEVVINVVSFSMVQQASLASAEYPKNVNEFRKAGFTEKPSVMVRPPAVLESPVNLECKVVQVIPTGDGGGAGNLVICEVILMHINDNVLDNEGKIDPFKLEAVGRLGGDYYTRVDGASIFKVPKPSDQPGMGIDQLPSHIRNSSILSGNDLGMLANVTTLPSQEAIESYLQSSENIIGDAEALHTIAKKLLAEGKVKEAWLALMCTK